VVKEEAKPVEHEEKKDISRVNEKPVFTAKKV